MSVRTRTMPGDRLCLGPDDPALPGLDVIAVRSRGWAELHDVRHVRADGVWMQGVVALLPSGAWWWVRDLEPIVDEEGG